VSLSSLEYCTFLANLGTLLLVRVVVAASAEFRLPAMTVYSVALSWLLPSFYLPT